MPSAAWSSDERTLRVPGVQTTLLWLDQAETLAHEVAHAWDDSRRSSGDQWGMDETERVDALVGAERWGDAVAAAGRALAMGTPEADAAVRLRLERARCHIELGDFSGANVDLDVVAGTGRRLATAARALRAESLLRQERWQAARAEATDALSAGPPLWPSALLTAVAWEAAARWARPARRPSRRRPTFA